MMSHSYPNVNKHVFSAEPEMTLLLPSCFHRTEVVAKAQEPKPVNLESLDSVVMAGKQRLSAPPPYAEEDPVKQEDGTHKNAPPQKPIKREALVLLEVAIGHRLASSITQKIQARRQAKLEKVHDAWMRFGLDTRMIASQGGKLPPHFWNPPNYGPQEMNARLAQFGL